MKYLVIGSSGFVGKNLFRKFLTEGKKTYGISKHESNTTTDRVDICDKYELVESLNKINPDIIINCSKLRGGLEYYDSNKNEAEKFHLGGIQNIADWCFKKKCKLISMSTDYVYPGHTNKYDENSAEKPLNFYGKMMLESEKRILGVPGSAVLRPTVIFGYDEGGVNFLMQVLTSKGIIEVPSDQISNPTDIKVLEKYVSGVLDNDLEGIYVATGIEQISRYDFAKKICKVFEKNEGNIRSIKTKNLENKVKRPLLNGTNSHKIRSLIKYKGPSITESLLNIKKNLFK